MKQLNQEQMAFLMDTLFYALEVNKVPKQRDGATAKKVIKLGNSILGIIGIDTHSELYEDAHSLMYKVYISWINTQD